MEIGDILTEYQNQFKVIFESGNVIEEDYYDIFKHLLEIFFKGDEGFHIQINTTDIWSHNIAEEYLDKPDFFIS